MALRWRAIRPGAGPEIGDDPYAAQPSVGVSRRISARPGAFVATAAIAYAGALLWTIPAAVVLPRPAGVAALQGTVWHGDAIVADGSRIDWRWAPLRSLVGLGFAVDWQASGAGTDLAGRALARPGRVIVDKASGSASGALVAALVPSLPFACALPLQIALERLALGGDDPSIVGEIRSGAGVCMPKAGGVATPVSPLVASFNPVGRGSEILLAPLGQRRRTLADGGLDRTGRLSLRVTPEGAAALPFLAPRGGMRIETTL